MYFSPKEFWISTQDPALWNNSIDGEANVPRPRRVTEAERNSLGHILNLTADGSESGPFLSVTRTSCQPRASSFSFREDSALL